MYRNRLVVLLSSVLCVPSALADAITDQIQTGVEAYEQQDYKVAIEELNFAISQIQEKLDTKNATLLPEPLSGWTADDIENNSAAMMMMGGGTTMVRKYRRDAESVEISIIANSPMLAGIMAMMSNPMYLSSSPDTKPYRYKRTKGILESGDNEISITLILAGQVMIKAVGQGGADEAALKAYLDELDFERIKQAFLQ